MLFSWFNPNSVNQSNFEPKFRVQVNDCNSFTRGKWSTVHSPCKLCSTATHSRTEQASFAQLRPSAHWVHTTWIDKVSPSPLPHLITDPSLAHRGIHATTHTESMRFVRHSCRFMSCGLSVRWALHTAIQPLQAVQHSNAQPYGGHKCKFKLTRRNGAACLCCTVICLPKQLLPAIS